MDTKDLNGPAPEEQSGVTGNETGNTESKANLKKHSDMKDTGDKPSPGADAANNKESSVPESGLQSGSAGEPDPGKEADPAREAVSSGESEKPESQESEKPESQESERSESQESERSETQESGKPENQESEKPEARESEKPESQESEKPETQESEKPETQESEKPETQESEKPEARESERSGNQREEVFGIKPADFHNLGKEELLKVFEDILESKSAHSVRDYVEAIKVNFYKRHKVETEQKRKRFMQEGGDAENFEPGEDPAEIKFKELYRKYRHSKAAHNRSLEQTKQVNLAAKMKVIEDLKELVNRNEDINLTFQEFRNLQKRWHEIGQVPQHNLKDLWNTYHHFVEIFYDHIKINKELRDLDLKKNFEAKIELCEKAEELLLESNVINAFRQLQKYHDQWRETGPVPRDQKDVIWERFREITYKINKKHQEHFDKLKETQKKNLETKTALCEKAEAINEKSFDNFQQVEKLTKEMIGLQRTWKTIGFAPKKDNTKIYQRFRNACDKFFARKREYNAQNKEFLNENLHKKLDLCVQAEKLKDSTDWKRTTDQLIALQKTWKEIGPVPRKHYDPLWKRFRAACDHFFKKKSEFLSTLDSKYEENLKKKIALIEKIESLELGSKVDDNLNTLKEYQREWATIGFVPIKEKENIQKRYRAALDKHFEGLKMDDHKKNLMKYKHKLEGVKEKPNAFNKLNFEREKFLNRFKQLENDITLWENNIGFFAKSKTAEATIKEFKDKIEQGKKQMDLLEEKIRMIDEMDN